MEAQKLDPEFKAKWLQALRSGEYKQSDGYLHDKQKNGYCCLGVACMVSGGDLTTVEEGEYPSESNKELPLILRGRNVLTRKLAGMNDGVDGPRFSFLEIADWIEANL